MIFKFSSQPVPTLVGIVPPFFVKQKMATLTGIEPVHRP